MDTLCFVSEPNSTPPSVNILGLGLIGGSLALACKRLGMTVSGSDASAERVSTALERGIIDRAGLVRESTVTFVATPVGQLVDSCRLALGSTDGLVTDVGSVKTGVVSAIDDPRFVGGHPMAGSELDGLDGADATMFDGCVWVLTPGPSGSDRAFSDIASLVSRLGAEVVALEAAHHDELVALVSHVPHLIAASLMGVAHERSEEHLALLRLAAGGFRDMTRIASGRPSIWLDICAENRVAISSALDTMIRRLQQMRETVDRGDRGDLLSRLEEARLARMNLPTRAGPVGELVECRIPIPDRPGSAAEVFALSGDLGVNIADFEVVHSVEGDRGIMVLVVRADQIEVFRGGLLARGFRPSVARLS